MTHSVFDHHRRTSIGTYGGAKLTRVHDLIHVVSGPVHRYVIAGVGDNTDIKKGRHKSLSKHIKNIDRLLADLPLSKGYQE